MDDDHADDWNRYGWDGYFALIKRHIEWETVEIEELAHKRDTERDLRIAWWDTAQRPGNRPNSSLFGTDAKIRDPRHGVAAFGYRGSAP